VRVSPAGAATSGIALAEVYDADAMTSPARLINVSTLGYRGIWAEALAPGFVIRGTADKRVLIRAVGPGLDQFGIGGLMADPQLAVIPAGQQAAVASNDNRGGTTAPQSAMTAAGAFGLTDTSRDAAAVVSDCRPHLTTVAALERVLGVRLVPRSRVPTDGLILRTAGAPARTTDAALTNLARVEDLIVEAELARKKVTDAGLRSVAGWNNLTRLDLTQTAVTSAGVAALAPLAKLEAVNLTATKVDDAGVAALRAQPAVKQVWAFGPALREAAAP
jgi:hypothetical protein